MAERKTRVVLVLRKLANRGGGAERLFCELANQLSHEGYSVECLHFDQSRQPPFYALAPAVVRRNLWPRGKLEALQLRAQKATARFESSRVLAPFHWAAHHLPFAWRLYRRFRAGRPDIVISFLPPANTPSLLAGHLAAIKVVPTNHNVPEQDYRSPKRWDQNPLDRWLRLGALRYAYRVHVLFAGFAEWFPAHIQKKILVVHNYVSPEFFVDATVEKQRLVLAVGRLAEVKNYRTLLDAWALLAPDFPDWRLQIYGEGPEHGSLQAHIETHGIAASAALMGQSKDLREAYRTAAVFCHPALFEGFGLSVAEALASGAPVVAFSDCAGVREFVHDGKNGLMVERAHQARALADGLRRLMSDGALRRRLATQAPGSVAQFSVQEYYAKWLDLIEQATLKN